MVTPPVITVTLAVAMGLRHALDADHLATVDGLTRWNASKGSAFAPYCGLLFAAGHCVVILLALLLLVPLSSHWQAPSWLAPVGAMLSATVLALVSIANLRTLHGRHAPMRGLRGRMLQGLMRTAGARQVLLVGALFAVSFDTLGITLLFAATNVSTGSIALAVAFCGGMLAVSALNGWWITYLLAQAVHARGLQRMSFSVAVAGLVAALGVLLPLINPSVDAWLAAHEYFSSALVITILAAGYAAACWSGRTPALRPAPSS